MSMSKKDFVALADALRPVLFGANDSDVSEFAKNSVINALARFCGEQNPNFKEDRWRDYLAGKVGPNGGAVKEAK